MKVTLRLELRRLFSSKELYIALAIGLALVVWLFVHEVSESVRFAEEYALYGDKVSGYLHYPKTVFNSCIELEYDALPPILLYLLFPIIAAFPYASTYCKDKKTGYLKNLLVRIDRRDCFMAKYIASFFSGFLVSGVILLSSLLLTMLVFPILTPEAVTQNYYVQSGDMFGVLFYTHPMVYTFLYILIDMLWCGCMASFTLLSSMFTRSAFLAVTGSFIVFEVLDYVLSLFSLSQFSPITFLRPIQTAGGISLGIILTEFVIFTAASFAGFYFLECEKDVF
ncbi:MAG: hypothetical protein LUF29_05945 [Oscillospiraceae bacterium]|nr:hypothetical protein [Oscillospiraceae bacterium]